MAWTPLASCWNSTIQWRNLQAVDLPARQALVAQELQESKIVFNNFSTWLGTQELEALGWEPDPSRPSRLVKAPAWLKKQVLPPMDWGTGLDDLEYDYQLGSRLWVYWLAVRSEMSPEANAELMGDLSWTRRPLGLFTPVNHAHGDGPAAQARRRDLPEHNLAEDARFTTWASKTPTLLMLSEERGQAIHQEEKSYSLLPTFLPDLGQRLGRGIPWLESYRVEARVYLLQREVE